MLKRSRADILNDVINNIEYNLCGLSTEDWYYNNPSAIYYNSNWNHDTQANEMVPNEALGWPPGLTEYIKRVAAATAVAVVDAIYTEQEMETKVEEILLVDKEDSEG